MRRRTHAAAVLLKALLLVTVFAGCVSTNRVSFKAKTAEPPRIVRISFIGQNNSFRIRVDQGPTQKFRNAEYTNIITQMNLGYGDIVVWEDQRKESGKEISHPKDISDWWFKYLKQNHASFYSIPQRKDFFSTEIFHWVAPFNPPRPLSESKFFLNGEFLGSGTNGFQNVIKRFEAIQSGSILMLAPRIKNEGNEALWVVPYQQLLAWSKEAGLAKEFEDVYSDRVVDFLDFGRFMDDD